MAVNGVGYKPYVYTGAETALNSTANSSVYTSRPSFTGDEFVLNNNAVTKTSSSKELKTQLDETRKKQGFIGKIWDGFKNVTGLGAGSNKAEKAIEKFEKGEISEEEALKAVEKYQQGQKQAIDFVADMATGIISVAGVALAIPTGGASLAVTIPAAMAIGAVAKPAIKGLDALSGGREYSLKEGLKDAAMGAVNGGLGILTAGVGKAVTSGAKNIIMSAVKEGALSTGKKAAIRVGTAAVGGSAGGAIFGGVSSGANYLTDGGSLDEGFANAVKTGAIGGAIFGGLTGAATEGVVVAKEAVKNNINAKMTSKNVLPNGDKTTFQQGATGDCHVLSTVDGMLNNPKTAKLIQKSITTMPDGNYQVKIGNEMVVVAKNAIPEGLLSDVQGVRIFEQAYKQMSGGNLDGGFADVVAKQFGLKPLHIAQADLSDDVIKKIAQGQDNLVLSAGIETGGQRHYLSVRNIDVKKGVVTLVDPKDTSKIIKKSLTDFKKEVISLDGGSIKKVNLPNSARPEGEVGFYGKKKNGPHIDRTDYNRATAEKISRSGARTNLTVETTDDALRLLKQEGGAVDKYIAAMLEEKGLTLNTATRKQVRELLCKYLDANLDVYNYGRIDRILKDFDVQIKKLGDGTVFFRPEEGKSYDILMALYKKHNPGARFVTNINDLQGCKNVVILDDCSVSGNSLIGLYEKQLKDVLGKDGKVQAFFLTAFDEGLERIKTKLGAGNVSINQGTANRINIHHHGASKSILPESEFFKNLSVGERNLLTTFLQVDAKAPRTQELLSFARDRGVIFDIKPTTGYQHSGTAILFDYMGPNNNSPFSSLMLRNLFDDRTIELPIINSVDKTKVAVGNIAIKEPSSYFSNANGSVTSQMLKLNQYIDAYDKFASELIRSGKIINRSAFDSEILLMMEAYDELAKLQGMILKTPA